MKEGFKASGSSPPDQRGFFLALFQRAWTTRRISSDRAPGGMPFHRARPPFLAPRLPNATAAGFFRFMFDNISQGLTFSIAPLDTCGGTKQPLTTTFPRTYDSMRFRDRKEERQ